MRSPAPRGRKKNLAKFRLRRGTSRGNFARFGHRRGTWRGDRWTTICSSALHGGPPPRPPAFNCPLFHTGIRSCTALALHVAVMDSACRHLPLRSRMLLSKHRQRPAAGSIPAQADARQGLLHGRLCYLKRCGIEQKKKKLKKEKNHHTDPTRTNRQRPRGKTQQYHHVPTILFVRPRAAVLSGLEHTSSSLT